MEGEKGVYRKKYMGDRVRERRVREWIREREGGGRKRRRRERGGINRV